MRQRLSCLFTKPRSTKPLQGEFWSTISSKATTNPDSLEFANP